MIQDSAMRDNLKYDTSPETEQRLKLIRKIFEDRGIIDVKFAWNDEELKKRTLEEVRVSTCEVLEAYLNGEHKPFEGCNDRHLA